MNIIYEVICMAIVTVDGQVVNVEDIELSEEIVEIIAACLD